MTWQPIETAPTDGTPVLLYYPSGAIEPRGKEDGTDPILAVMSCERPGLWEGYYSGIGPSWDAPTHWMPLPQPPESV